MRTRKNRPPRLLTATALFCLLAFAPAAAQDAVEKTTRKVMLGDTAVNVNVYEKAGARVTFFSPHHNEQVSLAAAKEAVARRGGRLVELVALDERGEPARRVRFTLRGKSYDVDPNRVFTENGRRCGVAPEAAPAVKGFADALLEIIFAPGGKRLRDGENFVVAVHNNVDVDERGPREKAGDLTAASFIGAGAYHEQSAGAFLSNREADPDNFVILSTAQLLGAFAERGFNVVLQKPAAELRGATCDVDDGSLSVYAALQNIPYINLEADARSGGPRQREMLEAVYALLGKD